MTARDVIAAHLSDMGFVSKGFVANHTTDRLLEALTAAGYAIVPIEPTLVMRNAGNRAGFKANIHDVSADVYAAMVTAAQAEQEKRG